MKLGLLKQLSTTAIRQEIRKRESVFECGALSTETAYLSEDEIDEIERELTMLNAVLLLRVICLRLTFLFRGVAVRIR
jgi:hypothetical protein